MNQLPRLIRRVVAAPKFSPTDWNVLARSFIQPIDAPNNLPRTKLKTFAEISNEGPAQTLPCSCQLQILSCNLTWTYVRHNYNKMEILLIYSRVERQRGCNLYIYYNWTEMNMNSSFPQILEFRKYHPAEHWHLVSNTWWSIWRTRSWLEVNKKSARPFRWHWSFLLY